MKKNLLTIGALALSIVASAQSVLCHVDKEALVYVSKDALVYNGGGLQIKETGRWDNHGNVMLDGGATDVFKTVDASLNNKTDGGNFYNRINDTQASYNYETLGDNNTYGQLYITGLSQANITGIVNQEYQRESHGDYQQIGIPFYGKPIISGMSTDLGVTFNDVRWSQKEILKWNNRKARFDKVNTTDNTSIGHEYYVLGSSDFNPTVKHEVLGRPNAEESTPDVILRDAGKDFNFGIGGNSQNFYQEKYNSYIQDGFEIASGGAAWVGDFGKNLYQFSNPYLTNLDLAWVAKNEASSGVTDGNNLTNIYGIRVEVSGVQYSATGGTGSTSYKFITFDNNGDPVGDVSHRMIRPMGNFVIKLKNNTDQPTFDFKGLRRFKYTSRNASTTPNYSVTAARGANPSSTLKQLGIIGLDENGNELGRTYYVVRPDALTGFIANNINNSTQYAAESTFKLGSYEENVNGGYDENVWNDYWLYINEANENNFQGKNIKVVSFDPAIKSYRFEIRENVELVANGTHELSQGVGYYYKGTDGIIHQVKHGDVISLDSYSNGHLEYDFYYGEPDDKAVLSVDNALTPSRTQIVYNPSVENHIVIFDSNWKKAAIKVYDMSGKLILSESDINTSNYYEIKLDHDLKSGYVVDITADNGAKVTKKILK